MVKLTIDGKQIEVPEGTRLFDACTEARGEPLPHFCYHPDLSIAGVCRLCQVEIEGMPKLTIACNTIVRDGMVVQTRSERVKRATQQILEMHLINHPVDCPICDQAGECGLQDQYMEYGLYESAVGITDKVKKRKVEVIGPHVILDQERCVLCTRCVRFCNEVTKTGELGIFNRGDRAEIGTPPGVELANNYSLNTVDICPVGALTCRDFRFQKRVWLLQGTPSVCPGCATGCNIRIDHAGDRIYRLKPRYNPDVNGHWMCDRGRMEYKAVHHEKRLTAPLIRRSGGLEAISWQALWPELTGLLKPGGVALALANPHQTLEELVLFRSLARNLAGEDQVLGGVAGTDRGEADELLLAADRSPNRQALVWLGLPEVASDELVARLGEASQRTVLIYGGEPARDEAIAAALQRCRQLVYFGTRHGATADLATIVVPLSMWAEKDGLFVNRQRRIQRIARAVARPQLAREDWRLLDDLRAELTDQPKLASLPQVRRFTAAELDLAAQIDLSQIPAIGLVPDAPDPAPAGGDR